MSAEVPHNLTDEDIIMIGNEAGLRILAMPDQPTQADIDQAVLDLGISATHSIYAQETAPEENHD